MPTYDLTIYLANGANVKIAQDWANGGDLVNNLDLELGKDICKLISRKEDVAMLVIKNPKENIVGYFVDKT